MDDIFTACDNNNLTLLDKIIKERPADINLVNAGNPILIKAIGSNCEKFVEKLIEAGANVNIKNLEGETPLIIASKLNREGIVTLLIKARAIIDDTDNKRNTALIYASALNNPNIVNILLNSGADINFRGFVGETALMKAIHRKNERIIDILLDYNADVNIKNVNGVTALLRAALDNNINLVNKLIIKGANVNIENKFGLAPLEILKNSLKQDERELFVLNIQKSNIRHIIPRIEKEKEINDIKNKIKIRKAIIAIIEQEKLDVVLRILNIYIKYNKRNYFEESGLERSGVMEKISNYLSLDSGNIQNKKSKKNNSRRKKTKRKNSRRKNSRRKKKS